MMLIFSVQPLSSNPQFTSLMLRFAGEEGQSIGRIWYEAAEASTGRADR